MVWRRDERAHGFFSRDKYANDKVQTSIEATVEDASETEGSEISQTASIPQWKGRSGSFWVQRREEK